MLLLVGIGLAAVALLAWLLVGAGLAAAALLACRKHGARRALPWTVLAALGITWLFDQILGIAPLVGLILGFQVERRQGYGRILAAAALPVVVQALLLLAAHEILPREELMARVLEQQGQLERMGWPLEGGTKALQEAVFFLVRLLPGTVFVFMMLTAVVAYRLGQIAAGRFQVALPAALPFRLWRPWSQMIWVLIAGLALKLLVSGRAEDLGLNLMMVMGVLYAVQGLAVVRFYAGRLGISPLLELVFYLVLIGSGGAVFFLPCLGLLDTWFDWRRLESVADQPPAGGGETG